MPSQIDMCLLQDVKQWVYGDPTNTKWVTAADHQLSSLITSASRGVLTCLQRPSLVLHRVTETLSGLGGQSLLLREYPVIGDLSALTVDGNAVVKRGGSGWAIANPWDGYSMGAPAVLTTDGAFTLGPGNVVASYIAGYGTLDEAATVPASAPYTIAPLAAYGRFAVDYAVKRADGTAMVAVKTVGELATGKYMPPTPPTVIIDNTYEPQYTFHSSDAGASVLLSYSYTPEDLRYAVMKWVGEWWRYKDHIGQRSVGLPQGAGTVTFDLSAMPADVAAMLAPYKRVVPI